MPSTTIVIRLLDKPQNIFTPRSYAGTIKKETKTYWLISVEGYYFPWKFSKSNSQRVEKPKHDQANYSIEFNTIQNTKIIDNLIAEATENHLLKSGDLSKDVAVHEQYTSKLMGCLAGIAACFGSEHEQYKRLWGVYDALNDEWREYCELEINKQKEI